MNQRKIHFTTLMTLVALLIASNITLNAQSMGWDYVLSKDIYNAVKTSNATVIGQSLNSSVELTTLSNSGVYGNKQAEMVISNFLSGIRISEYYIDDEKTMGNSTLTIGRLITNTANYRIYLLTKDENNKQLIQQFKIEELK